MATTYGDHGPTYGDWGSLYGSETVASTAFTSGTAKTVERDRSPWAHEKIRRGEGELAYTLTLYGSGEITGGIGSLDIILAARSQITGSGRIATPVLVGGRGLMDGRAVLGWAANLTGKGAVPDTDDDELLLVLEDCYA